MRFKIEFGIQSLKPYVLPVNYHNEFSAWIHKMLHFGNKDFISWLKSKGYFDPQGEYKLYTFSDFHFPEIRHQDDRIILESDKASMFVSFYAQPEIENFISGIFLGQEFKLGDQKSKVAFKVENLQKLSSPVFNGSAITFSCISPMLVAEPGKADGVYISPDQKGFDKVFFKTLMSKYAHLVKFMQDNGNTGLNNLQDLQFQLLNKPKPKIIKIPTSTPHQKSVKGYLFDFRIKAPEALLEIGYHAGFGDMNHLGFGCCETIHT